MLAGVGWGCYFLQFRWYMALNMRKKRERERERETRNNFRNKNIIEIKKSTHNNKTLL